MNRYRARRHGLPPGYAVKLVQAEGLQLYLADWDAQPDAATTPNPGSARYFGTLAEATAAARLADMLTGQKWTAATVPDAEPDLEAVAFNQAFADVFGGCDDEGGDEPDLIRTAFGFSVRR